MRRYPGAYPGVPVRDAKTANLAIEPRPFGAWRCVHRVRGPAKFGRFGFAEFAADPLATKNHRDLFKGLEFDEIYGRE